MEHSQIFQIIIAFIVSAASAWGGAKYALKYLEKTTDCLTKTVEALQSEIKKCATVDQCRDSKINCRADKLANVKELTDKIDRLANDVLDQNRRREDAKDDNQRIYLEITNKLARLEARLEALLEARD